MFALKAALVVAMVLTLVGFAGEMQSGGESRLFYWLGTIGFAGIIGLGTAALVIS